MRFERRKQISRDTRVVVVADVAYTNAESTTDNNHYRTVTFRAITHPKLAAELRQTAESICWRRALSRVVRRAREFGSSGGTRGRAEHAGDGDRRSHFGSTSPSSSWHSRTVLLAIGDMQKYGVEDTRGSTLSFVVRIGARAANSFAADRRPEGTGHARDDGAPSAWQPRWPRKHN